MEPISDAAHVFHPKFAGRLVGVCYLVLMASGFDLFYVLPKLHVRADAAATAGVDEQRWKEQAAAAGLPSLRRWA